MSNKTIAQRLREFANGDSDSINDFCWQIADTWGFADDGLRKTARYIAEKIEQEHNALIEAQGASVHHTMLAYAEDKGMPMEENETITQWLDRWFVPRPCFEDGQPVQWSDRSIEWDDGGAWGFSAIGKDGFPIANGEFNIYARAVVKAGRVQRKHPKVLDAEGVKIKVGDTVWSRMFTEARGEMTVTGFTASKDGSNVCVNTGAVYRPEELTHTEPDSLEKLRDDMRQASVEWMEHSVFPPVEEWTDRLAALMERDA